MLELSPAADRTAPPDEDARFLAGIAALLPDIRACAAETERLGRVPDRIVAALAEAGVFRAAQPRQWGGLELDLATFYDGMTQLASACASTGWVASVLGIHPWQIALFTNEAQDDVWRDDPDARASSSYAPTGSVRRAPGGFHLSGRWHFSSGVDHCTWALLGGIVPERDEEPAEFRTFLVPRRDFTIDDESWHMTGMGGTGSKDLLVAGAVVPEHRTHRIVDVFHGADPGFAVNDRPYFRLPWRLVFASTIAAPAIGAALGATEAFIAQNRDRVSAYGGPPVAQNPALYRLLAHALTVADAARTRMHATWTAFQATLGSGGTIPYEHRVRCLYECAHAHASCVAAVHELLGVSGGNTMRADQPMQRFFRDMLAMRNHPAANLEFAASLYAQARLGLPPPPFVPTQRVVL